MYAILSSISANYFSSLLSVPDTHKEPFLSIPKIKKRLIMSNIYVQLTRNFNLNEFACNDGSQIPSSLFHNALQLAINLQALRDFLDSPVHVNSGYRTEAYNKSIGGAPASQHLFCKAADIICKGVTPIVIASAIEMLILKGRMKQGGIGIYDSWVHYDIRGTKARWDFRSHKLNLPSNLAND